MPDQETTDTGEADAMNEDQPLEWGTSSFQAGHDVGLVSRHTVGLIERDNPSTRERLWSLVADEAALDDVLDELSSTGLKALPAFGVAQIEGATVRVVARGRTTITIEHSSGETREIDASGVRTWIEEVVADVAALTIALPPLDDDETMLSSESFAVLAGSVPAQTITRRYDAPDVHAEQAAMGWSAEGVTATVAAVEPETSIARDASIGVSVAEAVQAFDVESSPPSPPPPSPPPPEVPPASPQPAGPPVVTAAEPIIASTDGWDQPEQATDDGISSPVDDDSGSEPESEFDSRSAVLVFSTGERILIDRRVLIGRNPKVGDDVEGEMPHLMKFDGPGHGLSRTHAEISLADGDILLEDLGSTNGTEVQLPGQQRRRVRPGEPMAVVAGTLIDFGDELHCTIELAG